MRRLSALAGLLLLAAPSFAKSPPQRVARITFGDAELVVSGLTPGRSFALMGMSQEATASGVTVSRFAKLLSDGDSDGTVRFAATNSVLAHSIWTIVDLSSGRSATAASPGFVTPRLTFRPGDIGRAGVRLRMTRPTVFVARAGVGVWTTQARGRNGFASVAVGKFQPAPPNITPLTAFANGDVVLAIDEASFAYAVGYADLLGRH